uniref:G-protein coupled receptors family 1 profile domain-containing protein n=1 Tax=Parascaris univalens TaxID=6257 RepID=A0A915AE23_PARUN
MEECMTTADEQKATIVEWSKKGSQATDHPRIAYEGHWHVHYLMEFSRVLTTTLSVVGVDQKSSYSTNAVLTVTLASVLEHPPITFVREIYTWLIPLMITILLVLMTTKRIRIAVVILWLAPVLFILSWFLAFENDGLRHPKCRHQFYLRLPFRLTVFIMFMIPLLATLSIYAIILITLRKAKVKYSGDMLRKTRGTRTQLGGKIKLVWTTLIIVTTFSLSWGLCVLYFVLVCRQGCTFIYGQNVNFYVGFFINSTVNGLV